MSLVFHSRNALLVRTRDGRNVVLQEPLEVVTDKGSRYRAPVGTESDGASIPQELWSTGLAPFGPYWLAAVLHDSSYRGTLERQLEDGSWVKAMMPKDECDLLLLDGMTALGVEFALKEAIFEGVSHFGWRAFRTDRHG